MRIWRKKKQKPSLLFSSLAQFETGSPSRYAFLAFLPNLMTYLTLIFFLFAFIDPHFFIKKTAPITEITDKGNTEGIAIYLLLDQSGSMGEYVESQQKLVTKMELLKQVTQQFIEKRPNDLIGLIAFARYAKVLSPLTLDHEAILERLSNLNVVQKPDQDGTAIGYAIFKAVNLIAATKHFAEDLITEGKPFYDIKNSIVVIVTDGFQYPSPLDKGNRLRNIDLDEAAQYAKENHVRIYLVNIDPQIEDPEYAPQRHLMKRITELTEGAFFTKNAGTTLNQIYSQIDNLEKSILPQDIKSKVLSYRFSFSPYLILGGLLCLALSILLGTTLLKRVP